jgi:PAS domain S-box-containing protein
MGFFKQLFSPEFMPHGFCYLWDPRILWLHVISDGLITLSYYCIPVILVYFIRKHSDLPFNKIFWTFATFILACGTSHLMEIWDVWHGSYLIAGVVKAITAAASLMTAAMLIPFIPKVISLPERAHLQEMNRNLEREIAGRKRFDAPLDAPLRRRVTGAFVAAVLLMSLLGFLSWRSAQKEAKESEWVAHTHEVMTGLEATLRHLVDVETGGRGFALTGEEAFLEPYETGKHAVGQDLESLRLLIEDPGQARRLDALGEQAKAKVKASAELVATRRRSGTMPTVAQLERGKQIMDEARITIGRIKDEEKQLLDERTRQATAGRHLSTRISMLATSLGVVFLVIAWTSVRREISLTMMARSQVNALNADLEQRVAQRTAALGESEGRLAGVIQSAMDSIITVDEEHRVVLFNGAAERTFLCTAAEAMGQSINRFIPQKFHSIHAEHIRRFADTGVTSRAMGPRIVLRAVRADGEEFQIEASISQVVTGGKKLFTVILRDVTERVRSEELRERLAAIVESSDDAIISKTLDGTITAWNHGAEKIFGYSSSEAVGKTMWMILPPELASEETDILARIGRGLSVEHFETVRVRKEGEKIDVSVTISPIRDNNGVIIGASKVARDITERKQAEAARSAQAEELSRQADELKRSRQALEHQTLMLQSVLDSMTEGLAAADEEGKFVIWNTAAEKILGMGASDLPSQQWTEHYGLFLNDTVTPFPADQLPVVRAVRGEVSTTEMFVRNPKIAEGAWIEVNAGPLKDKQGMVRGGVAAFRDITRSRADEREIRKLNDELEIRVMERTAELETANKELEAFSYSVSHDLRAPLRHIGGFSQLLTEEFGPTLDPEARRYLDRIQAGTQRMGLLVDELLNLAKVGRHALNLQPTSLNAIVAEVIAMLEPECEGRQVQWVVADLPGVHCDPVLVKQIFQNLLANALKFSRNRKPAVIEVEVTGKKESGQSVFIVRDNGVGFDMKYVDKLFGVFQRLHRTEDFEGTGIGLATVQRIVQKHGGRVWAEAEADKGAAFYFTLGVGKQTELRSRTAMAGGR